MYEFANKAAIVGIGQTEFSKESGRSQMQLAAECSAAAIAEAGLKPSEIDGLIAYTVEDNEEHDLLQNLGIEGVGWSIRVPQGGGGFAATMLHAAGAVVSGVASAVLVFRAFNERSGRRFGRAASPKQMSVGGWHGTGFNSILWSMPYGVLTPSAMISMNALNYMREYGVTNEDVGQFVVVSRDYASRQPTAWYYGRPLTIEEHQQSPWIIEPVIRKVDCCQESDGGVAYVVTTLERARDLAQTPVVIKGATQDLQATGYIGLTGRPARVAEKLYASAKLEPDDVSAALFYDAFAVEVLMCLEAFGFAGAGEAKDFIRAGQTRIDGRLPLNMNGGHLGEAYIHGMNLITEGVRQVRGTAVNQVADINTVLVGGGSSAGLLGRA